MSYCHHTMHKESGSCKISSRYISKRLSLPVDIRLTDPSLDIMHQLSATLPFSIRTNPTATSFRKCMKIHLFNSRFPLSIFIISNYKHGLRSQNVTSPVKVANGLVSSCLNYCNSLLYHTKRHILSDYKEFKILLKCVQTE